MCRHHRVRWHGLDGRQSPNGQAIRKGYTFLQFPVPIFEQHVQRVLRADFGRRFAGGSEKWAETCMLPHLHHPCLIRVPTHSLSAIPACVPEACRLSSVATPFLSC